MSDSLHEMSLRELELRIRLADAALRWLRSSDPMLQEERYYDLVAPAIERYTGQLHELIAAREKKLQPEPVVVGLKSATIKTKVGGF